MQALRQSYILSNECSRTFVENGTTAVKTDQCIEERPVYIVLAWTKVTPERHQSN